MWNGRWREWVASGSVWIKFCNIYFLLGCGGCDDGRLLRWHSGGRRVLVGRTHSDMLPNSWALQELGGWNERSSVWIDVVTAAEKLGDWRVAWMCCSISAGKWERDWFNVSVTEVSSTWFKGGLSGLIGRERAASSFWRLKRSWLFCCTGEGTGGCGQNWWWVVGLDMWALFPAAVMSLQTCGIGVGVGDGYVLLMGSCLVSGWHAGENLSLGC